MLEAHVPRVGLRFAKITADDRVWSRQARGAAAAAAVAARGAEPEPRRGFLGRGRRGGVSDRAPRAASRARQCQGRCSRRQLTSGGARGTEPLTRSRAAVQLRASPAMLASPAASDSVALLIGKPGVGARYSGAEAVPSSQVPEVARVVLATASARACRRYCRTRRTPIVLHQVLW